MLLKLDKLIEKYSMKITGVIHVGAHYGEEIFDYVKAGIQRVVFFEADESSYEICYDVTAKIDGVSVYCCALGSARSTRLLNTEQANNGQSNSLLKPKKHLQYYPDIVFTGSEEVEVHPLDRFNIASCNFLVADVQGYELEVLKGATETLKRIDYVYLELNREEMYEGCAMVDDIDKFLSDFTRVETKWTKRGYGDGLYIRRSLLK